MSILRIEVYFDLICPWCLIGKRNLESALATLAWLHSEIRPELHWQPVQLLPEIPEHGIPFGEFYERRLGSGDAVIRRQDQVRRAAESVGVEIAFEHITVMPNTARAHRLLAMAEQQGNVGLHTDLLESLFCGYFQQGQDIGDTATLLRIADSLGLNGEASARAVSDSSRLPRPAPQVAAQGVPYFVFDRNSTVTGAVGSDTLLRLMREAHAAGVDRGCKESRV